MGLFSKYRINCCTFLFGFGIGVLLTEIGWASSLTRPKFSSSLSVSPDNNLLISSLRLVFILLLYIILFLFERTICILVCGAMSLSLDKPPKTGSNRIPKAKSRIYNTRRCRHVLYYSRQRILHDKCEEKRTYDQHSRVLPPLWLVSRVATRSRTDPDWSLLGTILELRLHRTFVVQTEKGSVLIRNRRYLKPVH